MRPLHRDPEMMEMLDLDGSGIPVRGDVLPPRTGAFVGGAYEGADRYSRELATWDPSYASADDDLLSDKDTLDARVRDTYRNDAYVRSASNIRKDRIVGSHYLLNSKPAFEVLGLDEKWAEEFQQEVEVKFTLYAESINNWIDAARQNTLTELIRLAVGLDLLGGEVLASFEWIESGGRPYSTAIQMIDPDRLSTPPNMQEGRNLRGGIRKDRYGAPQTAYIRSAHPSDWFSPHQFVWKAVPFFREWGRHNLIHIFEQERPGQSRGIAGLTAALKETRVRHRFRDTVLQNAILNATYAASIESELPTEAVYSALGAQAKPEDVETAIESYAAGYLSLIEKYNSNAKNMKLDGVRVPHLLPGTKLQLRPAGQGGPLGTEFEQSLLRHLAANLDMSYEELSRDMSGINYSTMKAALNQTHQNMVARKRAVADRMASTVFMLWLEEAFARREITSLPRKAPNFWEGLNREAYSACEWIGASRGQIDELKETQAAVLRIKYGLTTREDELGRLGKDWRKVFGQLEREQKLAKERNLLFTEDDNMMNAASGAPREQESRGEKEDGSEDKTDV